MVKCLPEFECSWKIETLFLKLEIKNYRLCSFKYSIHIYFAGFLLSPLRNPWLGTVYAHRDRRPAIYNKRRLTVCWKIRMDLEYAMLRHFLILSLLMNSSIYFDTMSLGVFTIHIKGGTFRIYKLRCTCMSRPKILFFSKQCSPGWNAVICGISTGSSLFTKVPVYGCPVYKG